LHPVSCESMLDFRPSASTRVACWSRPAGKESTMSRRTVLSAVKASRAISLRTAGWRSGFWLLGALLPLASACGHHGSRSQTLRTCVDRWNQGNMVGWGPGPVNVAFRRPNAKEHSSIQLSSSRLCIVGIAVGDGTWTCAMSSTGAYWCPPLHEATGAASAGERDAEQARRTLRHARRGRSPGRRRVRRRQQPLLSCVKSTPTAHRTNHGPCSFTARTSGSWR